MKKSYFFRRSRARRESGAVAVEFALGLLAFMTLLLDCWYVLESMMALCSALTDQAGLVGPMSSTNHALRKSRSSGWEGAPA